VVASLGCPFILPAPPPPNAHHPHALDCCVAFCYIYLSLDLILISFGFSFIFRLAVGLSLTHFPSEVHLPYRWTGRGLDWRVEGVPASVDRFAVDEAKLCGLLLHREWIYRLWVDRTGQGSLASLILCSVISAICSMPFVRYRDTSAQHP